MTEQWQELKETITEMRDNDGTGTQQEVCKFLANYMETLEKQMQQPSEDCISREEAISIAGISTLSVNQVVKALEDLPSVTSKTRWIPVNERLPEEFICDDGYVEPSDYVLVWGDHGNYGVSRYWGNRKSKIENPNSYKDWMDLDWVVQKPIAWMPLPQPYKAESEDEE